MYVYIETFAEELCTTLGLPHRASINRTAASPAEDDDDGAPV